MTKQELYDQMRNRGYDEPGFFAELDETESMTGTVAKLIRQIEAGKDAAAWAEVERLHDEHVYFSLFGDDCIVCQATE